jgi:hypothetical protein
LRLRGVDEVWLPDFPLTIRFDCPTGAVLLAVRVNMEDPIDVGLGENDALTPLGRPETARLTLPVNP